MNDPLQLGREPALPIYRFTNLGGIVNEDAPEGFEISTDPERRVPRDYDPGRIIWDRRLQTFIDDCPDYLLSILGPNDILAIDFYRNSQKGEQNSRGTSERLPQFERNIEFAIEVSCIVKRILVGNQGCELFLTNNCPYEESISMRHISELISTFIRDSADELRGFGIEPMYASSVMMGDCYNSRWLIRDTLAELGVWNFWAMPFQGIDLNGPGREKLPFPALREYLSGAHFFGGVNFHRGLRFGMDEFLKFMNFRAGVMGGRVGSRHIEYKGGESGDSDD